MKRFISFAIAVAFATTAFAQQPVKDAQRRDAVVQQAMKTYQQGLDDIKDSVPSPAQPGTSSGALRELRLEDAVALALEKNLDIQVAKLEPQSSDFLIAGFRNLYRPNLSSTLGLRDQYLLPTTTLTGGTKVNNGTATYNFGLSQLVNKWGGSYTLNWSNSRLNTSNTFSTFNPSFQTNVTGAYIQPLLRGFKIDNTRQQLLINTINRDISEETARATVAQTLANVRNAYWDLVFAQSAVDVAQRATELADKLVEDNQARVEVGTLAPLDIVQAQAEAATRRQNLAVAEATAQTAELALKRFIVSGTDDPLWRQTLRPVDLPALAPPPTDVESAVRGALINRTDILNAKKNLDSNDISMKYFKNQSLPALDLNASYGLQGLGGTAFIRSGSGVESRVIDTRPGGYLDALSALTGRAYPTWNLNVTMSYPIGSNQAYAQLARTNIQRQQAQTRLRSLEIQIAAEVTNAALTVQSNLKRVEAATAARGLAQKRLEAEQSKFEVGMTTNFFVVQAQRDLRDAANTELRALADYRKSLVNFERAQVAPAGGGAGLNTGGTVTTGGTGTTGVGLTPGIGQ
ncbi:MAG: TolC family protein [Cyanobacteria bacterium]|nr:TolC family protein [Cyanobacteriota bacterium]